MRQTTSCLVMVPPKEFSFNYQTAVDNAFQSKTDLTSAQLRPLVMAEFKSMVKQLRDKGVEVIEFDYELGLVATPDAVFPNNWFSTTPEGNMYLFPMACENRQHEVRADALIKLLASRGYQVKNLHDWREKKANAFLESTGVLVMDHRHRIIYAALSQRCDAGLLQEYADEIDYTVCSFDTRTKAGTPVYHTNVIMAVGDKFVVICDEVIVEKDRVRILTQLEMTGKTIIRITEDQMGNYAGNLLQISNKNNESLIALSFCAYNAFTPEQIGLLNQFGTLMPLDIHYIETIGGGSVRCMLGEVFL